MRPLKLRVLAVMQVSFGPSTPMWPPPQAPHVALVGVNVKVGGGLSLTVVDDVNFSLHPGEVPLEIRVARGGFNTQQRTTAQAVFVNVRNPLQRITLAQLAAVFGRSPPITRWGQLGLTFTLGLARAFHAVAQQLAQSRDHPAHAAGIALDER